MSNPNEKSGSSVETAPEKSVIERCPCGGRGVLVAVLVRVVAATASASRTSSGPARVTSDAYRDGWSGINWGTKVGAA